MVGRTITLLKRQVYASKLCRRLQSDTYGPKAYKTTVTVGSESYTSKHGDKFGGSEVFKCCACGMKADRDVRVAYNILLRFLDD